MDFFSKQAYKLLKVGLGPRVIRLPQVDESVSRLHDELTRFGRYFSINCVSYPKKMERGERGKMPSQRIEVWLNYSSSQRA